MKNKSKSTSAGTVIRNTLIALYVLVMLGISATARAEMRIFPIVTGHEATLAHSYVGDVVLTTDGRFYLIVTNEEFYELKSNVDLQDYNGMKVQILAVELMHKVGPVFETASLDPLQAAEVEGADAPVLVVFGISEFAE